MSIITIEPYEIKNKKGTWNSLSIDILEDGSKIGSYTRNYSSIYNTFHPFEQDGKRYALYSTDYTATRVMTLPDCKDLCGEDREEWGFCPTDYYVPKESKGLFGFVAGCVWGDDTSWKIQYLDLRNISEGKLVRDDKFGYIELPRDMTLEDAIDYEYDEDFGKDGIGHLVYITCGRNFRLDWTREQNEGEE